MDYESKNGEFSSFAGNSFFLPSFISLLIPTEGLVNAGSIFGHHSFFSFPHQSLCVYTSVRPCALLRLSFSDLRQELTESKSLFSSFLFALSSSLALWEEKLHFSLSSASPFPLQPTLQTNAPSASGTKKTKQKWISNQPVLFQFFCQVKSNNAAAQSSQPISSSDYFITAYITSDFIYYYNTLKGFFCSDYVRLSDVTRMELSSNSSFVMQIGKRSVLLVVKDEDGDGFFLFFSILLFCLILNITFLHLSRQVPRERKEVEGFVEKEYVERTPLTHYIFKIESTEKFFQVGGCPIIFFFPFFSNSYPFLAAFKVDYLSCRRNQRGPILSLSDPRKICGKDSRLLCLFSFIVTNFPTKF